MSLKKFLTPSLLLTLSLHPQSTLAAPVDRLTPPTPARSEAESLTSRELRNSKSAQLNAGIGPILIVPSLNLGFDYYLNEQMSVGVTGSAMALVITGSTFLSGEAHLKRFLGNSFYVKLLTGALVKEDPGDDVMPATTSTDLTLQINIGNEWFISENSGWYLSYITLGYTYNIKRGEQRPFGAFPMVGIFSAL